MDDLMFPMSIEKSCSPLRVKLIKDANNYNNSCPIEKLYNKYRQKQKPQLFQSIPLTTIIGFDSTFKE